MIYLQVLLRWIKKYISISHKNLIPHRLHFGLFYFLIVVCLVQDYTFEVRHTWKNYKKISYCNVTISIATVFQKVARYLKCNSRYQRKKLVQLLKIFQLFVYHKVKNSKILLTILKFHKIKPFLHYIVRTQTAQNEIKMEQYNR